MYQQRDLERLTRHLSSQIEDELSRVGLFFRIFYRVKSHDSFERKIKHKGTNYYDGKEKFLRDIIGIRIILYFADDTPLVNTHLKKCFSLVEETIDENDETTFAPTRENLIFKLPTDSIQEFTSIVSNKIIDTTFEIQLRTILSEGWHEIDHDLRYKCTSDWDRHKDLGRNFNGILAALENSEYSTLRLFDQLSYRHYKSKEFIPLLRTKFRLRFINYNISEKLSELITDDLIKEIYKLERTEVLKYIFESRLLIPMSVESLIYFLNYQFLNREELFEITPKEIMNELHLNKSVELNETNYRR